MRLTQWMTLLAVTGAISTSPLFAQDGQGMQDPAGGGMQGDVQRQQDTQSQQDMQSQQDTMQQQDMQAQSDVPWANQQASLDAVRKLQKSLNEKGHDAGAEDGLLGPKTQAALRDFQQSQGLDASGEINADTLTALDIDSSEFAAFGIKEEAAGQESPGAMDQGAPATQENGGAVSPSDVPESGTR